MSGNGGDGYISTVMVLIFILRFRFPNCIAFTSTVTNMLILLVQRYYKFIKNKKTDMLLHYVVKQR